MTRPHHKARVYETKTVAEIEAGLAYYQARLNRLPAGSARAVAARRMVDNYSRALPIAQAREDAAKKAGRR